MKQYLDMLNHIVKNGKFKGDRTGTGTYSVFGYQNRYDLNEGFPLVTTKKMHLKSIIHELLWFIKGDTNIKYLNDNDVHIWDEWANENGDLGPVYGKQWRRWDSLIVIENSFWKRNKKTIVALDQLQTVIDMITNNPDSRRLIVTAWNPNEINRMALPACHCLFQFYVYDNTLSCQLYQRSADVFLGVPFNIASYALLTYMVAHVTGLKVGEFIHTFGDLHIYKNHLDQVFTQLSRNPLKLPDIKLNESVTKINDFHYNDIEISNYNHHPAIKAPIAV